MGDIPPRSKNKLTNLTFNNNFFAFDSFQYSVPQADVGRYWGLLPRPTFNTMLSQNLLGLIAGATHVGNVVSVYQLSVLSVFLHTTLLLGLTARQETLCMHRLNKHTGSSSWDQTACRALGSKGAERRDTWPAVNKEHPLWTTQHPADTHRQTPTHTNIQHTTHRDTIFTLYPTKYMYSDECVYTSKNRHTHYHAIFTRYTDEQTNKDKQINKQQIHIMAATETADHTVALSLFLSGESRNSQSEGFREREWKRVCGWVPTLNRKQKKKKTLKHQNMSEWIITIPRHRGMEREGGRREEAGGETEGGDGAKKWGDGWERLRLRCHTFQTFISLNKCLHMGTYSTQTYTDKDSNYSFCHSLCDSPSLHTHTHIHTHTHTHSPQQY